MRGSDIIEPPSCCAFVSPASIRILGRSWRCWLLGLSASLRECLRLPRSMGRMGSLSEFFFLACLASLYCTYSVGSPRTLTLHNVLLGNRSALTRESVVLYALGDCPPLHTYQVVSSNDNIFEEKLHLASLPRSVAFQQRSWGLVMVSEGGHF
jgi:hypothetical protein